MIKNNFLGRAIKFFLLLTPLVFLSSCRPPQIKKSMGEIKQDINQRAYNHKPITTKDNISDHGTLSSTENAYKKELTRDEAVRIALKNNPELKVELEGIGIAHADLIQAGLFTNPQLDFVVRFPTQGASPQTNIETSFIFRLSDLWQVPLKKKVSEDKLAIQLKEIVQLMLDIIAETRTAFDDCIFIKEKLNMANVLVEKMQSLKEEIDFRKQFGYSNDFDIYLADVRISLFLKQTFAYEADLQIAHAHLKRIMGIKPTRKKLKLNGSIDQYKFMMAAQDFKEIQQYALSNRPEIQINILRIRQYRHVLSLEKAQTWKDIWFGIAYKQDFDKPFKGWGAALKLSAPIFDINFAQIVRVKYQLKQAENELDAEQIKIREELIKPHSNLNSLKNEILIYENQLIPSYSKAIDFALFHATTMQLPITDAFETTIRLYESHESLVKLYHQLAREFVTLERASGKGLNIN